MSFSESLSTEYPCTFFQDLHLPLKGWHIACLKFFLPFETLLYCKMHVGIDLQMGIGEEASLGMGGCNSVANTMVEVQELREGSSVII